MDNRRVFLVAALAAVLFLIYQAWLQDYGPKPAPEAATPATASGPVTAAAPALATTPNAAHASAPATAAALPQGQEVHVHTDVLDLVLSTAGGDIRRAALLDYPEELTAKDQPVRVLDDRDASLLVLQTGLEAGAGAVAPGPDAVYTTQKQDYVLADGQDKLEVALSWQYGHGLKVTKTYRFSRGSYEIGLSYEVQNGTPAPWSGGAYAEWQSRYVPVKNGMFSTTRYDYQRVGMHGADGYHQFEFSALATEPLSQEQDDGWIALVEHYFMAAIIPAAGEKHLYYSKSLGDGRFLTGSATPSRNVAAGATASFSDRLFVGPKLQTKLAAVAPGLELTVDYGKLTIIAQPIFWVLEQIERLIKNWGWSILLLTVLIKAITYKLNEISGRSMAKMRQVQPRIKAIQERYADDRQRMSQAMMELYKKEKINPASGCFPILVQIPIFFALYYVLVYSVELRQAPWTLWIKDLSAPDPFYVLPVLYGIAMFIQQHLQPQPTDKMQARMMKFMPVALIALYMVLPSGLVLYYFANSIISIAQQRYINRLIEKESKKS
ncbi:MAG TPA: membrane protein insertase YidC [Gammaproteobacteria bacterium]|nr:membrane protein insertase YidC [Gammaproteobacteria bacterium]